MLWISRGIGQDRTAWEEVRKVSRVAEEGSDKGGREGGCGSAERQDRTAWEEVGKVSRVAEEGSDKRGRKGGCGSAEGWGRTV